MTALVFDGVVAYESVHPDELSLLEQLVTERASLAPTRRRAYERERSLGHDVALRRSMTWHCFRRAFVGWVVAGWEPRWRRWRPRRPV
jgi:hypothetical protein